MRPPPPQPRSRRTSSVHDSEFGRLAISTPSYNTAVIKPFAQGEGGLDLVRLFDARQRPLTTLGRGLG